MKKYRVGLGDTFDKCPLPWKNMIISIMLNENHDFQDASVESINVALSEFNGKYDNHSVVFEDETSYLMFVLKYS